VKVVPEIVKPKESGYIVVTYNAKLDVNNKGESNWGSRSKRMYLIINGDVAGSRKNGINVRANLVEDFSHLTKRQLAKAPKISFDTLVYNFGTITQGDVVKHDFVYKNLGKNPLFIRKVKGSWGCTAVSKTDSAVNKGETGIISASFNSRGKRGSQHKTITVITNDPAHQTIRLKMVGTVQVKKKATSAPVNNKNLAPKTFSSKKK